MRDFFNLAGLTGLEPAAFCVTGRRSNQLSYNPKSQRIIIVRFPKIKQKVDISRIRSFLHFYELYSPISLDKCHVLDTLKQTKGYS